MAATNTSGDFTSAVREALIHLAEVNGLEGYGPGWEPPGQPSDSQGRAGTIFISNLFMTGVAWAVVAGRIYARAFVVRSLGGDDYAILGAVIVMTVSASLSCWGTKDAGIGRHIFGLEVPEIILLLKLVYVLPIIYTLCIFFVRISVLLFYCRLFGPNRKLRRIAVALAWCEAIYTIAAALASAFICNPVRSWWDLFKRADDCPTFRWIMGLYIGVGVLGVVEDILIFLLPMKFVIDLKLPIREKVGLCLIFGLGALACVAAVLKINYLPAFYLQLDFSWNALPVITLDRAEQCLGIITACTPALTALIPRRFFLRPPTPETPEYELTPSSATPPCLTQRDGAGFHFLKYAYDPDGVNMVCATAYATRPRWKTRGGRRAGRTGIPSADLSVRWLEPGTISKTTTVEVKINRR